MPSYSRRTRINYKLDKQKSETVSPGVYRGGIEVAGDATLNLEPGTYILDQGNFAVSGNATVNGAGVTIILTSRSGSSYGTVDIRGGSTIALSAPGDGAAAGIRGSPSGSISASGRGHSRRRRYPERQRCALLAEPPGALLRRLALRDPLQSAGGVDRCVHREFLFPPRLRGRRRLRPRPTAAASRLAARVDDGEGVGVDAVPSGKGIEAAGGGLLRR